jgi:hypothetical protein
MDKMKIASVGMFLLFVLAMAVQLNDPDPFVWVALYGIAAALSAITALGRALPGFTISALVLFTAGVVYLLPSLPDTSVAAFSSVGMSGERDELVRELWGLIICAVWTGVLLARQLRRPGGAAPESAD